MAYRATIEQHAECYVAKSLASRGGAHIMNALMEEDMDNGMVVKQDAFVERDLYKVTKGADATFAVRDQDPSALWLIEVVTPGDEFILTTEPIENAGYESAEYTDDRIHFNGKDEVARAHYLSKYDTYLVSAAVVDGDLAKGASLRVVEGKLTVA